MRTHFDGVGWYEIYTTDPESTLINLLKLCACIFLGIMSEISSFLPGTILLIHVTDKTVILGRLHH